MVACPKFAKVDACICSPASIGVRVKMQNKTRLCVKFLLKKRLDVAVFCANSPYLLIKIIRMISRLLRGGIRSACLMSQLQKVDRHF